MERGGIAPCLADWLVCLVQLKQLPPPQGGLGASTEAASTEEASGAEAETAGPSGAPEEASAEDSALGRWTPGQR